MILTVYRPSDYTVALINNDFFSYYFFSNSVHPVLLFRSALLFGLEHKSSIFDLDCYSARTQYWQ